MSQVNAPNNLFNQLADQLQTLTNPTVVLGAEDISRINGILLKSYLQAGATLLDGISAAVKAAVARTEERTESQPPTTHRVTVE